MPARSQHLALLALFVPGITGPMGAQQTQNVTELYVQDSLRLDVGEREGLSVQAFDEKGNVVLLIKYRSSDETVARVQPNGTVTGVRAGTAKIVVQAGAKTRKVLVVVSSTAQSDSVSRAAETRPPSAPAPTLVASLVVAPSAV
ncbi:MAG: Ig-like domain-containing protein, partial [Gemmatimonadales bacterium]